MRLLIIIPAYNEKENICRVVDDLIQTYPQYDYVVVNDGSSDTTGELCRTKRYNLIDLPMNVGLAAAVQTGMKYAWVMGYDAALQFDGDGQHDACYIAPMLESASGGAEIVIGSRFKERRRPGGMRMAGNWMIEGLIRLTTGVRISDPTSGMRLYSRDIIREFATRINYGPEPDTIAYLVKNGAKVAEIQVEMNDRTAGESYFNLFRAVRYMTHMFVSIALFQPFRRREE